MSLYTKFNCYQMNDGWKLHGSHDLTRHPTDKSTMENGFLFRVTYNYGSAISTVIWRGNQFSTVLKGLSLDKISGFTWGSALPIIFDFTYASKLCQKHYCCPCIVFFLSTLQKILGLLNYMVFVLHELILISKLAIFVSPWGCSWKDFSDFFFWNLAIL